MAVAVVFEFPGEPVEKYEKVFTIGGDPISDQPHRISHVCYRTDDGFAVVDVWDDEDAAAAFGAIIGPATQEAGLGGQPKIYPVQGYIGADGVRKP